MTAVSSVAVVGAGFAGAAAAILLAKGGVRVDLFDAKSEVGALGSGITVQGNACRIFEQLGIWDVVQKHSYPSEVTGIRAPDANGTVLAVVQDAKTGGPDFPAVMGMYRPEVAQILIDRAIEVGVNVRWSARIDALDTTDDDVTVHWKDAEGVVQGERYDLVIGADGLHSAVRRLIGIETEPRQTGMGIWRAFVPRPTEVTRTDLTYGGPCFIAGYCPTSEDRMYAYLVEEGQDRSALTTDESVEVMRSLAAAYHGPWDEVRESLGSDSRVHYTWFTTHIVEGPWHRGRVALVGDAAHSCPPTLAQGAAMALEDSAVLAELLLAADVVDEDLWQAYSARRLPRARAVVDGSMQLSDWLTSHNPDADFPGLMARISTLVSLPA